jgi:hypothetical protein
MSRKPFRKPSIVTREYTIAGIIHDHEDPFDALAAIESEPGGLALLADPNFVGVIHERLIEKFSDVALVLNWMRDIFEDEIIAAYYDADNAETFAQNHDPDLAGNFQDPRNARLDVDWSERCDENFVFCLDTPNSALQLIADCDEPQVLNSAFADAKYNFADDREFLAMALAVLSKKKYDQAESITYLIEVFGESCISTLTKKESTCSVPTESY